MDGIEELKGVVVLGASNRFDMIDPAILRPGRFDLQFELPVPDEKTRLGIFKIHTKGKPLDTDVDFKTLAKETEKYTGADIEAVTRRASGLAIREFLQKTEGKPSKKDIDGFNVKKKHFEEALKTG